MIKDLLDRVPTLDFLAVRFTIAGLVMLAIAHRAVFGLDRRDGCARRWSSACIYGVAQILQTAGLAHTAASVSGFITGMYVVCTPLLAAAAAPDQDHRDDLGRRGARDRGARAC